MTDWTEATDPVPQRRELTDVEKRRRLQLIKQTRRDSGWLNIGAEAPSAYHVEPGFDDVEG